MGSSVLNNGLATVVAALQPTTNYDFQTSSGIRKPAGSGSAGEISWLMFFSRPFPLKATIVSARIVLYTAASAQTGSLTMTVKRPKTSFSFSKVTYNTRPTTFYAGSAALTKTGPIVAKQEWSIDVTAMMASVALGEAWYGFHISSTNINPALVIYGPTWTDATLRPRLEVEWSDEPDQPRTLAPSGGRAVSIAKPVLRCDYVDVSGSTQIQSIQVQINATDVWTAPTFDSGAVAVSSPELDLATTAYAGLTDGQTVFWRVRVQDGAGLWSDYSAAATFTRDSKGTLAITNPPVSPNNFVEEDTPPISWTFTGETQAAYQLAVTSVKADGSTTSWTSGKITSAVQTVTLPTGVLTTPDAVYTLTIRIWDTKQRETTAGDTAYVELTRDFTYAFSALTSPVTSLATTWLEPYPKIDITWSRATDPDSFTIMRNRVVIATGLLPGDVRVSGQNFHWVDLGPSPQVDNVYEVLAVVNSKAATGSPTSTRNIRTAGIFLADITRTNDVLIVGKTERNFTYGESSEVLEVVGSSEVLLVTQAMRGLEGVITGELQSVGGLTAQQWKAKLLAIKREPGRIRWLTVGDLTMQVVIRALNVSSRPTPTMAYTVSFEFYQVGTLEFAPTL